MRLSISCTLYVSLCSFYAIKLSFISLFITIHVLFYDPLSLCLYVSLQYGILTCHLRRVPFVLISWKISGPQHSPWRPSCSVYRPWCARQVSNYPQLGLIFLITRMPVDPSLCLPLLMSVCLYVFLLVGWSVTPADSGSKNTML